MFCFLSLGFKSVCFYRCAVHRSNLSITVLLVVVLSAMASALEPLSPEAHLACSFCTGLC